MSPDEFDNTLRRIGFTQVGAAHQFDYNERTVRRWASGELPVPRIVRIVLWLMLRFKVKPGDLPRL